MPAKSAAQFGLMEAAAHGHLRGMGGPSKKVAQEFLSKTSKKKKSAFAKALARRR